MLERLARLIDRRRRAVLLVAVLGVFAAGAYGGPVVGLLDVGDDFSDPDIQAHVRDCFERLVREVTELSESDPESVWTFFAQGMLLNVTQSLDLEAIADQSEWAASWCNGPPEMPHPPD